ncbi:MAG: hypothetical protein JXA69_19345 [Phycisphaerae bacterium]|nr:hypothetical protein [Phycisphaerae bacterium]
MDPELLGILVCPKTHAALIQVGDWLYSTDSADRRKYPIRDGIPIMLIDESVEVSEEEFQRATTDDNQAY